MKILAISGSGRAVSTNTAMLRAVAEIAQPDHDVSVFSGVTSFPVFSPDLESRELPAEVQRFVSQIEQSDCLIIASPEYVHTIPGGLKNAIDWLVSRDEIITKPIALMHASHRGEDMLAHLRLVLGTVSQEFTQDVFLRFELIKLTPDEIGHHFTEPSNRTAVLQYLQDLSAHVQKSST
jgi:NAD(P)H-dependent FMN reductase